MCEVAPPCEVESHVACKSGKTNTVYLEILEKDPIRNVSYPVKSSSILCQVQFTSADKGSYLIKYILTK